MISTICVCVFVFAFFLLLLLLAACMKGIITVLSLLSFLSLYVFVIYLLQSSSASFKEIETSSHWASLQLPTLINIAECIMSQSFLLGCMTPSDDPMIFWFVALCRKSCYGMVIPLFMGIQIMDIYTVAIGFTSPPILVKTAEFLSQLGSVASSERFMGMLGLQLAWASCHGVEIHMSINKNPSH